jgi:AcrR family transcriptional regulator
VEALLAVAEQQFLKHGFAGTSIAEIARAAGIEPGSVYWYFRSKEHAFAAVLHRLLDGEVARIAALETGPTDRLLAALDSVDRHRSLYPCVYERAPHAPPVLAYHERLYGWLHQLVHAALTERTAAEDRALAADAVVAAIEGALTSPTAGRPATAIVSFVLDTLTAAHRPVNEPHANGVPV